MMVATATDFVHAVLLTPSATQEWPVTTVQPEGLHHVTAIASDPQRNLDFWFHVLGQRLIKQTVNFDAPDVYHLYYGNEAGEPGTVMTFFPFPGASRGRIGAGQTTVTSYSIPEGSLGWWRTHLTARGVEVEETTSRFEEDALRLRDPDGLVVELIAHEGGVGSPWDGGPIPVEHAIRGFHSVTLTESSLDGTAGVFLDTMNFDTTAEGDGRFRFEVGEGGAGRSVDVVVDPSAPRGLVASGTVHHIAWRVPDASTQVTWRDQIVETGTNVTEILDRQYFRSIYFREPGGVLLEIATDPPGFTADEPLLELGRKLKLPPWLEPSREAIEANLLPLKLPELDGPPSADVEGGA
jgi:glyoxalase family protein